MSDPTSDDRDVDDDDRLDPRAQCDDTLEDEPAPDPQGTLQKRWLMEQRFVHGLLRAMHSADAQGRQTRVAEILAALPKKRPLWARFGLVAAAAALLVLGAVQVWRAFASPAPRLEALPKPERVVEKALASMREDTDRRYDLEIRFGKAPREIRRRLELTLRPGRRFLLQGQGGVFPVPLRAGCDGKTLWIADVGLGFGTIKAPLQQPGHVHSLVGEFVDVGLLDLETILTNLPKDCELRSVRREPPAAPGQDPQIRIEATRLPERVQNRVREAFLLVEESTGVVRRIEIHGGGKDGTAERSFSFEYAGVVQRKVEDYAPPK